MGISPVTGSIRVWCKQTILVGLGGGGRVEKQFVLIVLFILYLKTVHFKRQKITLKLQYSLNIFTHWWRSSSGAAVRPRPPGSRSASGTRASRTAPAAPPPCYQGPTQSINQIINQSINQSINQLFEEQIYQANRKKFCTWNTLKVKNYLGPKIKTKK